MIKVVLVLCLAAVCASFEVDYLLQENPYQDALIETKCPPCCPPDCCPQHIGPPCPIYYDNDMPDYTPGDSTEIPEILIKNMTAMSQTYLTHVLDNVPPSDPTEWSDVFTGTAGRALMFMKLHLNAKDAQKKTYYLNLATQYINTSLAHAKKTPHSSVGFLLTYIGTYSVAAMIAKLNDNQGRMKEAIDVVRDAFIIATDNPHVPCTQDYGKAGLLYAAFLLNDFFDEQVIPQEDIVNLGYDIINVGLHYGNTSEMIWPNPAFPELLFWGEGHGNTGVLFRLLAIPEIMANDTARTYIRNSMDFLVTLQFPDGNFPTPLHPPYPTKPDILVQWCHGAPGFIPVLARAYKVFNDTKFLHSAERAADCVWRRGLLTKGLMLGHGISGNTYMQLFLYKTTGYKKYLYRSIKFQEYVLSHPVLSDIKEMRQPTPSPFMPFVGSYGGAIVLWSDFLTDIDNAKMPGFEVGF